MAQLDPSRFTETLRCLPSAELLLVEEVRPSLDDDDETELLEELFPELWLLAELPLSLAFTVDLSTRPSAV